MDLLAAVVNKVWFLDAVRGELDVYNMTWQRYLEARSTDEQRRRRERANAEKKASVLMTQAAKLGAKATKAAAAHQMVRRAEKLIAGLDDVRVADRVAKIRFPQPAPCGRTPLTATNLSKSYGSLEIFTGVDLAIDRGSRVVVLGLNGAGKTTLLKLLGGSEKADTGEVLAGHGLRLGYYAQEHETIDPDAPSGRTPAAPPRTPAPRSCGICSAPSCSPANNWNSAQGPCPAARRPGWHWPVWSRRRRMCCCWTSRPTTSTRPAGNRCWTRCGGYAGAVVLVTHDPGAVTALHPERVLDAPCCRAWFSSCAAEIGVDAARWYLVSRGPDQAIEIDIDLAAERSQKNPVYYVQYAHARIAGILRNAGRRDACLPSRRRELAAEERDLIKRLAEFPALVAEATARRGPHAIPTYAIRLADDFHRFYHHHKVLGSETEAFRLGLCTAARSVIARSLDLIGVEAPDTM